MDISLSSVSTDSSSEKEESEEREESVKRSEEYSDDEIFECYVCKDDLQSESVEEWLTEQDELKVSQHLKMHKNVIIGSFVVEPLYSNPLKWATYMYTVEPLYSNPTPICIQWSHSIPIPLNEDNSVLRTLG